MLTLASLFASGLFAQFAGGAAFLAGAAALLGISLAMASLGGFPLTTALLALLAFNFGLGVALAVHILLPKRS